MKKTLVAVVVVLAAVAVGQEATPQAQQPAASQQPAQPSTPAKPQQKKEIKNPAEYNAYVGAVNQTDPNAKISGLEAFLTQYPNSVMKEDALELLMAAYLQTGNQQKMIDTAQRLLQADPNNVRSLAILASTSLANAQANRDPQTNLPLAKQYGEKGLQALQSFAKPEGMADAEFAKQKAQMSGIFNAAVGVADLNNKDYAAAQKELHAAVEVNPNDFSVVYPLALAYLQATPPDYVNGVWFAARAGIIAPTPQYQQSIQNYAKLQYKNYHGSEQGWDDVLNAARTTPLPPATLSITKYVPPTPAEQCTGLLAKNDPKKMAFAEWELCLSAGTPEDADKVWTAIKGTPLIMEGVVISVDSPSKLGVAASSDDIDAKRADISLTMTAAIPAKLIPKVGATFDFEGTPVSYQPSPFVMMMDKGTLVEKAPAKKPPVHRRPGTRH
jgi:tetratricopeptide (TPR) repeat protein